MATGESPLLATLRSDTVDRLVEMRWWPLVGAVVLGAVADARAEGVCVAIDVDKDNLGEGERSAVRVAVQEALSSEGVLVDREGRACSNVLTASSLQLGKRVTTTLTINGQSVTGNASSLDEVDLLVRQLVRSLVTGRSLATGFGVTDRTNVLRDQTAPRRASPSARRWDPVVALGGGMLQLPATDERPLQRQYSIVALEVRTWGFLDNEQSALEVYGRVLLHDYDVIRWSTDRYDRVDDGDARGHLYRGSGVLLSPFGVANYEGGLGAVSFLGTSAPRPFVRVGATASLLLRVTDPDHRIDLGFGGYVGIGLQLSDSINFSVAANVSNPVVHDFMDAGYWYFLTTTAMLEFRARGRAGGPPPSVFEEDAVPVMRRIND